MNEMMIANKEIRMTSVEVTDMINQFREMEGNRSELRHSDLMRKIEKELEMGKSLGLSNERNISLVEYVDKKGEIRPCYSLDRDTIISLTVTESFLVRRKMIEYINKLEEELQKYKLPQTYKEALLSLVEAMLSRTLVTSVMS